MIYKVSTTPDPGPKSEDATDSNVTAHVTPPFAGGERALPQRESKSRTWVIRAAAVVALGVSLAYLIWRVGFTLGNNLWLSIPLWLLEVHAVMGLALFAFSLWDLDDSCIPPAVTTTNQRVAILIATYDEPSEILLPTIAAAAALAPGHETWVLDDGNRPWVQTLAASLGANYLARSEHLHAKAGNLNNALAQLDAHLVAILDADHVVTPGFLTNTLGYFDDPKIAVVQTPQDFYNVDSFEHDRNRSWFWRERRETTFNEQRLFYRAIQPGKNRWGAAFWCGTNAVVRTAALRDVGGVATETLTEDIHTTIRMHRRGWHTVYHNEVLAHGLAARNSDQYQSQRLRWGTGAMQLLHTEHPLTGPGLTMPQRIAYAATILGWFDAWRTLGYVLLPLAVIFSGASPIHARALVFLIVFSVTFLLQRLALALLSRGYAPLGLATIFEFVRMQTTMSATLSFLRPGERTFRVTDKSGSKDRRRNRAPWLLWLLLALSAAAALWLVATLFGYTPVTYANHWIVYSATVWMTVNAGLLVGAIVRIRSDRFANDRRTAVRLLVKGGAHLDSQRVELLDISMGGALVRVLGPLDTRHSHELQLQFRGSRPLTLRVEERTRKELGNRGTLISMQFASDQDREIGEMSVHLFSGSPNTPT